MIFKVPLFKCKWVNQSGGGVQIDPQYGMTTVDLKNLGYTDEPFVLANDVAQVIYLKDMSTRPRKRKDKEEERRYSVLLLAVHANKNQYLRFLAASAFFLRFTLGFS